MEGLASLFSYLESKYGQPISLEKYLTTVYTLPEVSVPGKVLKQLENGTATNEWLTFACDGNRNIEIIEKLRNTALSLKKISTGFSDEPVATKLIDNYIRDLGKLMKSEFISDGEKMADKIVNIMKKTLMKLWGIRRFADVIRKYFLINRIQMVEYAAGHKLSDDEFELLDDKFVDVLSVKAQDDSDKYKVIEMWQPIIQIYYIEEDSERYYKFLPGHCKFYV